MPAGRKKKLCPETLESSLGFVADLTLANMAGVSRPTAARWRVDRGLAEVPMKRCPERPSRDSGSGRPRSFRVEEQSKRAYELRRSGLSWSAVAKALLPKHPDPRTAENTVTANARRYAKREGLKWPLKSAVIRHAEHVHRGRKFYRDANSGLTKRAIAAKHGEAIDHVSYCMRLFMDEVGAPKPPRTLLPSRAYMLRLAGHPWKYIQGLLGYKHRTHTTAAARVHALKNGLPWPIVRKEANV
jgi:hypothetical protein